MIENKTVETTEMLKNTGQFKWDYFIIQKSVINTEK